LIKKRKIHKKKEKKYLNKLKSRTIKEKFRKKIDDTNTRKKKMERKLWMNQVERK